LNDAVEGFTVLTVTATIDIAHDWNCNDNALEDEEAMK
jgi:hypothetical protein